MLSGERVERRLAAVLATDIVGYSRLMGADEEGTLHALRALRRALIDPKITEHRGRLVKDTGDGALVEFASVSDRLPYPLALELAEDVVDRRARRKAVARQVAPRAAGAQQINIQTE